MLYGVAVGLPSIMLYVAYQYMKKPVVIDVSKMTIDELQKYSLEMDIKKMGTVQLNGQYLIPFESFIDMFKVIRHHAKVKLQAQVEKIKGERRETLKRLEGELGPEYKQIVIQ